MRISALFWWIVLGFVGERFFVMVIAPSFSSSLCDIVSAGIQTMREISIDRWGARRSLCCTDEYLVSHLSHYNGRMGR